MNSNKSLLLTFLMLVVVAAVYRVIPDRPYGFAPQWAMALFAGSVIKNKKWAIAFPILSMFLSDLIYEYFHSLGVSDMPGFYAGQLTNYVLFAAMTVIGFYMKRNYGWECYLVFGSSLRQLFPAIEFLCLVERCRICKAAYICGTDAMLR